MYDEGTYRVKVLSQEMGESQNGNVQFILTIQPIAEKVLDGTLYECPKPTPGREPRIFLTFTDKTIDWVTASLRHIGFKENSFSKLDPTAAGYQSLVDVEFEASCTHDEYNGHRKENWQILRGKTQVKPAEPKKLRELDARFGNVLSGTPVNKDALAPAESAKKPEPAMAGVQGDARAPGVEIPF